MEMDGMMHSLQSMIGYIVINFPKDMKPRLSSKPTQVSTEYLYDIS